MSTGNPELFVVCKSCGSEVSPYITECPYCGNRLRKRAPKIDRDGRVKERRRRRPPTPSLSRLRPGEIPGIRAESRPYATIALVLAGLVGCLLWRTSAVTFQQIAVFEKPGSHWWRLITSGFAYSNTGYAFITLGAIAVFGWLLERRHGPLPVIALYAVGAVGGTAAAAAVYSAPVALGGNGGALALVVAWAIPDLLAARQARRSRATCWARCDRTRGRADAAGGGDGELDPRNRRGARRDRDRAPARVHRTAIAPGGPATSRPITVPGTLPARLRAPPPAARRRSSRRTRASAATRARRRQSSRTPPRRRGCAASRRRSPTRLGPRADRAPHRSPDGVRLDLGRDTAGAGQLVQVP